MVLYHRLCAVRKASRTFIFLTNRRMFFSVCIASLAFFWGGGVGRVGDVERSVFRIMGTTPGNMYWMIRVRATGMRGHKLINFHRLPRLTCFCTQILHRRRLCLPTHRPISPLLASQFFGSPALSLFIIQLQHRRPTTYRMCQRIRNRLDTIQYSTPRSRRMMKTTNRDFSIKCEEERYFCDLPPWCCKFPELLLLYQTCDQQTKRTTTSLSGIISSPITLWSYSLHATD